MGGYKRGAVTRLANYKGERKTESDRGTRRDTRARRQNF